MATINLPHVEWREGRPRFNPSKRLRALGFVRTNLEGPAGAWMTLAEEASRPAPGQKGKPVFADGRARPATPAAALTVEGMFEQLWREPQFHAVLNGRPNPRVLAPKTIQNYKSNAGWLSRNHPNIWQSLAHGVTRKVAKGLYKKIWEQAGLSQANAVIAVCRVAWANAFDDEDDPQPFNKLKLMATPERVRVGTPEEIAALLSAADREREPGEGPLDPEMGDAIVLALYTGQRQGDVLELREEEKDAKGRLRFVQNKTGAKVLVRALPQLAARLEEANCRCRIGHGRHAHGARRLHDP